MEPVKPLTRLRSVTSGRKPQAESTEADQLASLLRSAGLGDEAAFAALYDATAAMVIGVVTKVVRDPSQSEEIAQEAFVEIWRLAPRYDPDKGSARGWIATVAHRRAIDRVRSEEAHRRRDDKVGRQTDRPFDEVSETVLDQLDESRVVAALETLTDAQRQSIELAYYGGHTYREVAALLDLPEGTIKTRIRDGLVKLRDHLGVNQ